MGGDGAVGLELRLLAGFVIERTGEVLDTRHWRVRKAASLVKILALTPSHRVRREELMDLLWPDLGSDAAANNLRFALHVARQALFDAASLPSDGDAIRLSHDGEYRVDVDAFESAAGIARSTRTRSACDMAIALYQGDLLPEDAFEDWSVPRREQLRASFHALLRQAAALASDRSDLPAAHAALERLVQSEPTDEPARVDLMRSYAKAGEPAEAMRHYDLLVSALRSELDAAPEPATAALYREITGR